MNRARCVLLGTMIWFGTCSGAAAEEPSRTSAVRGDTPFGASSKFSKLSPPVDLSSLPAQSRDSVIKVVKAPTISAISPSDEFASSSDVYLWLLDHPDRVSLAWRRLNVTAIDIAEVPDGKFIWKDDQGSELCWRTVAQNADGRIWYAEGKVRASSVLPVVQVKAVAVLRHGVKKDEDGETVICHQVEVFLQTDSRAASVVLRLLGPAAPRIAQDGAEQLLLFFSGIARHLDRHPLRAKSLLAEKK